MPFYLISHRNDLIVSSLPIYTENLMEILPLLLSLPLRFCFYVFTALYRLQWVALSTLITFFGSYFLCTLFVDKQSRMNLYLLRQEPVFGALLSYSLAKWEEISMSGASEWFLEKVLEKLEKIVGAITVHSFYDALSATVQNIAQSSIPIFTSWLLHRYSLSHHASGQENSAGFQSFLMDNRKSLRFMGDGCQEIVDHYEYFEKLYVEVKILRPLLSLTESHAYRPNPFQKQKHHLAVAAGQELYGTQVVLLFDAVYVDAPRKSVDEIPHTILRNVSFKIYERENVLVTGPSGIGKTTLFRAILRLWYIRRGSVYFKYAEDTRHYLKLSMDPVLIPGNFFEQVCYPRTPAEYVLQHTYQGLKERLLSILAMLELGHLAEKFPLESAFALQPWQALSLSERQRLQFVRVFIWRPRFIFLEESTSGMAASIEARVYRECCEEGIQMISIDDRQTTALPYFHKIMQFGKEGKSVTLSDNKECVHPIKS
jgi:ABC-type uncharacterized transport system fused permease/ATPase subunit